MSHEGNVSLIKNKSSISPFPYLAL